MELVIFKSKRERFNGALIIKLNGKRLYSTETVKYLSVKIGENLTS